MTITKPSKTYSFTPGTGIRSSQTNTNFDNVFDVFEEDAYLAKGWFAIDNASFEYNSANSIKTTSDIDVTGLIQVGDKITFEQATDGEKFFFITAIDYNSTVANRTYIEVYGGTDYDVDNEAITADTVGLSRIKAPFGFPLNPNKWSIKFVSTSSDLVTTSTSYGSFASINVPAGIFHLTYSGTGGIDSTGGAADIDAELGLSTVSTSIDIAETQKLFRQNTAIDSFREINITTLVSPTSSTTYHLVGKARNANTRLFAGFGFLGAGRNVLSATIAYL